MAVNVSPAMAKHYRSMFVKYKARIRAIDKAGLNLDIAVTSQERLLKLGIDPMQKKLSLEDISKLSRGTVLESFLDNRLSTAAGRRKVFKEIGIKTKKGFSDMDAATVSKFTNFITTNSYAVAVSLGILDSYQLADIFENSEDSVEDIDLQFALDETINEYLNQKISISDIYQTILDQLQ